MWRRLSNFVAAASLLLCVAVCVLWVRSYWVADNLVWRRVGAVRWVASAAGQFSFGLERGSRTGYPAEWYGLTYSRDKVSSTGRGDAVAWMYALNVDRGDTFIVWERGGFGWCAWGPPDGRSLIANGVAPFWSAAAVTSLLPLAWTARRLRSRVRDRRRARRGLCPACGYDVRATPGRCPECGTPSAPPR